MTHFKSGDLVVLKSGGPTMTIDTVNTDIFDDGKITGLLCVWFVGDVMQRVRFDHRAVKLVAQPQVEVPSIDGATTPGAAGEAVAAAAEPVAAPKPATDVEPRAATEPVIAAEPEAPPVPATSDGDVADGETAAPSPEAAAPQPTPEAAGDYAAVLDSMVGAMNAAADLLDPAPRPARRAKATVRATARSKTTH
ncbi:MAG: YodC family protein [Xanthobacteraceae bacterium]